MLSQFIKYSFHLPERIPAFTPQISIFQLRVAMAGDHTVAALDDCIKACDGSVVFAKDGSHVLALNGSRIVAWKGANVVAQPGATVLRLN